jgi:hypothetical protein
VHAIIVWLVVVLGFTLIVLVFTVAMDYVLEYARETIIRQRGTVVPALFTLIGLLAWQVQAQPSRLSPTMH